jgi:hypothetical protein
MLEETIMAVSIENRKFARTTQKSPVIVGSLDSGDSYTARMVNYSSNGMYLETDSVIPLEQEIFIGVGNLPPGSSTQAPKGYRVKVIWQKKLKDSIFNYGYGVHIVSDYKIQKSQTTSIQKKQDRRKHPRKSYRKPVFFTSQNQYYEGTIKNISRNGAFIEINRDFPEGQSIRLVIPGTKIDKGVMLKSAIVRKDKDGIGVQFLELKKQRHP